MSEKTEQPTSKRLRDARQKGQVAKSKDFTQTFLIVALFGYLVAGGAAIVESFSRMIVASLSVIAPGNDRAASTLFDAIFDEAAGVIGPVLLIVIGVGVLIEVVQTGGILFAFEALKPKGEKLNPATNAKNLFSKKNLVEFVKSLLKVAILLTLVVVLVRGSLPTLIDLPHAGIAGVGQAVAELLTLLIANVAVAYVAISLGDLVWQRLLHRKELMMSKEEVQREYKEMEGDPHVKQHRKRLHHELQQRSAVEKSAGATALITNPTHLAIALRYDADETPLPVVLAKGEGALAQRMIAAAREKGVPIFRNVPLAHALFREAPVDHYIPGDLVEPVAEVLRLVAQLAGDANASHVTEEEKP